MAIKARRAARGELTEPSVVQTPRARLLAGIPNSAFGLAYYPLLAAAVLVPGEASHELALLASLAAAGMSAYLAFSLLFRTRMSCPLCWTAHTVNWLLPLLLRQLS